MLLLSLLVLCLSAVRGAKILAVFSVPSASHHVIYHPIIKELSSRNHEVTVITPNPMRDPSLTNLEEIDVSFSHELLQEMGKSYFEGSRLNAWQMSALRPIGLYLLLQAQLEHPDVKSLLNNETKHFDVVLVEPTNPLMYAFGGRFNCPNIAILSHFAEINNHYSVGNPSHPIIAPDAVLGYASNLIFLQRLNSFLHNVVFRSLNRLVMMPFANMKARKYFRGNIANLYELENNVSLLLTATHPLLNGIRPNVPTVIELGKVSRLGNNQTISPDLQKFLNSAKEGVVYFSLGSMMKSKTIAPDKLNLMKEVFSKLPQKILWKWETDFFPNKPNNVKLAKWVPQIQVLNHPNVKAFVTQGGPQSIEEAIMAQVPVLTMPIQFDQFLISENVVKFGIGRKLDIDDFDKRSFSEALEDVINNSRYKRKIKELATLIEDEPMNGLDKAVWWIEYVIRHKGTKHLRNPAGDIPLYQYYLLDIITVVLVIASFILYLLYKAICAFVGFYFKFMYKNKTVTNN